MSGEDGPGASPGAAAAAARERRREQLRQWGARAGGEPGPGERRARTVRFERAAEFLAACAGGDLDEARLMLRAADPGPGTGTELDPATPSPSRAVLDSTNADGISALHQACIDENLEVVRFLVEQGATVDQADNEGWTPLHVAASCGYLDIARYLLSHGANIAAVNSDGDLPLDLAESDAMEGLLKAEIARRGVDVEAAKRAEEELLLHDTRCWLNGGAMPEARHPRTGASALHVAAAKGYIEVMRLLLQAGYDPELRDGDGWTPLHAAAHWGVEDACRLLAEHGGGMDSLTHAGQRPCDLADEEVLSLLEELAQKQEDLRNQKAASQSRAQEPQGSSSSKHRRSSVCRLSSREKISLQDLSKERRPGGTGEPLIQDDDDGEEALSEPTPAESRTLNGVSSLPPPNPEGPVVSLDALEAMPALGVEAPKEAPFSRRFGLQKTGSAGTLGPADMRGAEGILGDGLQRSASSSWLEGTSTQAKEPRLARITPTPSRRVLEPSTLFPEPESPGKPTVPAALAAPAAPAALAVDSRDRRRSYQMPVRDEESESQRKARSRLMRQSRRSTQGVTLTDLKEAEKAAGKTPEPEKSCPQSLGGKAELADISPESRQQDLNPEPHPELEEPDGGFRKLYAELRSENERLREALTETTLRLAQLKVELERATQRQERFAERPALLELERFERRALERKAAELEEELKALSNLRADNQRLKDENAALIRVISKLSK
ncbi:protein phosphatase 1 regulatory subunit 12C isoform X5 [Rousettus aegyptiacus]|uniref:protein phosphatase 1 regulatory subunit 12C isoform X5 n=1 Tax=Rousettus aegyptiacus TaxID=9407 RepID=UPI00168CFE7A|nr:protein phosphatase 1 regulatory subunit 12C isoform X5 [Rousettus aegyptiacus]